MKVEKMIPRTRICSFTISFAFVASTMLTGCRRQESGGDQSQPPPVFPVETAFAAAESLVETITLLGTVNWSKRIVVRTEIQGHVLIFNQQPGVRFANDDILIAVEQKSLVAEVNKRRAELQKGETELARLEAKTRPEVIDRIEAELKEAQAVLRLKEHDYNRVKTLHEQNVRTESDLIRAESDYQASRAIIKQIRARLDEARNGTRPEDIRVAEEQVAVLQAQFNIAAIELDKATIRAPFDGVVLEKYTERGAFVNAGDALLEIAAVDSLEAYLEVSERHIERIRPGRSLIITADAFPGVSFPGEVIAIIPTADPRSRNVTVRASFEDAEGRLIDGMFIRVTVPITEKNNTVTVPQDALVYEKDKVFVYKVQDGAATKIAVRLGLQGPNSVEVLEGIRTGDEVVTTGGEVLFDGASVKLVKEIPDITRAGNNP